MAHYLFNCLHGDPAKGSRPDDLLAEDLWGVDDDELHAGALAPGDLVVVYTGAPDRVFVGRAELASGVHEWTPAEARAYPGQSTQGVRLTDVEHWFPPVPMTPVLARIPPSEKARADFEQGVVGITPEEYDAVCAVADELLP